MITPVEVIREAVKAVPAVKYALGVGGVFAVVAVVYSFKIDLRVGVVGTIIMFVPMGVLVVFARMAALSGAKLHYPVLAFTWFVLALFIFVFINLSSSVFFGWPQDLRSWIAGHSPDGPLKPCRDKTHGVESYRRTFAVELHSPPMSGGYNQDNWCDQVISEHRLHPFSFTEVLSKSENSISTCAPPNCPNYVYSCRVRVKTDPIYVEKVSSACK